VIDEAPPILEISVSKIENAEDLPFSVRVSLVLQGASCGTARRQIALGNFSVFPPNQPGRYALRVSGAFRTLRAAGFDASQCDVSLVVRIEKISQIRAWTPLRVQIQPPEWRHAAKM
jgi:hypothetical protein